MFKNLYIYLMLLICSSTAFRMTADEYETIMMNLMDNVATVYNSAYQFAVRNEKYHFEYATGVQDHAKGTKLTNTDAIGLGSMTKAFTVAGIAQQIDKGVLHWNDTVD